MNAAEEMISVGACPTCGGPAQFIEGDVVRHIDLRSTAGALAIAIADGAVRADIECYAFGQQVDVGTGYTIYSLTETVPLGQDHPDGAKTTHVEAIEDLRIVQRAAAYIRARGNVFPWRLIDVEDRPGWVRFVDKEGRPVDPGAPA